MSVTGPRRSGAVSRRPAKGMRRSWRPFSLHWLPNACVVSAPNPRLHRSAGAAGEAQGRWAVRER